MSLPGVDINRLDILESASPSKKKTFKIGFERKYIFAIDSSVGQLVSS